MTQGANPSTQRELQLDSARLTWTTLQNGPDGGWKDRPARSV